VVPRDGGEADDPAARAPAPAAPAAEAAPRQARPARNGSPPGGAAPNGPTAGGVIVPAPPPEPAAAPVAPAPRRLPGPPAPADPAEALGALLSFLDQQGASDLHLSTSCPPVLRLDGDIVPLEDYGPVGGERLKAMLWSIAPDRAKAQWEERRDSDFAHETPGARFRVNVFADRRGIGAVMRRIPTEIRTAEDLGLSPAVLELCALRKGLVLVTGPTGSGKSTTLAALVDHVNRTRDDHIITIEDPIEFVHPNRRCVVNQREVGSHTESFKTALRAALREDPDVVLVGELRDLETIAIALETAETGHLVFGTLHTNTAPSTVDRIIDQFSSDRQAQVRTMLSESLKGVVSQTLCKKAGGGRVAALEVLLCTSGVANLIREGKTFQIPSVMQTSRGAGMVTLNDSLLDLVKRKLVEPREAWLKSAAKAEMKQLLERAGFPLADAA
jgi:twitching motility protein PilT